MFAERNTIAILLTVFLLAFLSSCSEGKKEVSTTTDKDQSATQPVHSDGETSSGKDLFITCTACHGENAEGNKSLNAPTLVNQESWYLERQLKNFKVGIRGADEKDVQSFQMATIAKTLKDDKAINDVVAYIKSLPSSSTEKTLEGDIQNGKDYYNMICGACHGPGAIGNELLNSPALVGINDWYLVKQIHSFKDGTRGMHADDEYGAQMKLIAETIPNEQLIADVVAYIRSLEGTDYQ